MTEPRCPHCGFVLTVEELKDPGSCYLKARGISKQGKCWSCGEVHMIERDGTVERLPAVWTAQSTTEAEVRT